MNSVDKFDQNKKSCEINRKARKWWHRLFFHFIDTAITTNTNITMKDFRRQISRSLVSKTLVEKRAVQNKSKIIPLLIIRKEVQEEDVTDVALKITKFVQNGSATCVMSRCVWEKIKTALHFTTIHRKIIFYLDYLLN
ncbi:piggyBac transposable element-derived protein 4-like [Aphis craccivora]|uniref:PiggyBac transposable element-derived protein 4-like n=1 Tax=Aphis craccivora TaxID=307492 RepID=A0A6G0W183_APHCR|nr:piggyBac transposable element-derived protein 4-like [Aphis craccivora]